MKELIYLDTSFIHSFIAQYNGGLPQSTSTETQETQTKTSTEGIRNEKRQEFTVGGSSGELKFLGIGTSPSLKSDYKNGIRKMSNKSTSLAQTDAGKEIVSKQLHDNALKDFETYLENNEALKKITIEVDKSINVLPGEFIKIIGDFSITSLQHLKDVTQSEVIIPIMNSITQEEIEELENAINLLPKSNKEDIQELRRQINNLKKDKSETKKSIEDFERILAYLVKIFPTESFARIGNYVCPMKTEFLRETPNDLSFKYGNNSGIKITIIGKFTRAYDQINSLVNQEFEEISNLISGLEKLIEAVNIIKKEDLIVSPIAIYFENLSFE